MEELTTQHPPERLLSLCNQIDAQQKAWLITRLVDNIDQGTLNFLCEMPVTPALQALLDVEAAIRGLGTNGDADHLDAQLEDLHATIEALNEHASKLHDELDRKRKLEGK
jgi:hypothetical protein